MMDIINLTKWELFKIIKNKFSLSIVILVTFTMAAITFNEYNDYQSYKSNDSSQEFVNSWIDRENFLLEQKDELLNDPYYDEIQMEAIKRRLEIAEYKIATNTERNIYKNKWYFFSDNTFKWVSIMIILFTAIIGAFNLATEYSDKTINQILLLPYKRSKILTAKYLATLLSGMFLFLLTILLGIISGLIIYGFKASGGQIVLYGNAGPYTISMATYSLIVTAMQIVNIIFYITLAFFIAVTLKSASLATIVTILTITLLHPFVLFASKYYNILNILPFNNLDFRKFFEFGSTMPTIENFFQSTVVAGYTPLISAMIILVYLIIFISSTFYFFCKRDIR